MSTFDRKTMIRAGQALGASLAVVLLVTAFVSLQAPAEPPPQAAAAAPPIALPPLEAPPEAPAAAAEAPPAQAEEAQAKAKAPPKAPAQSASRAAKRPPAKAEAAARVTTRRAATPPAPSPAPTFSTVPVSGEGLRVRFKTVDDLVALVGEAHVDIVLEYADGARYLLPRDLSTGAITFRVNDELFDSWLDAGRVTELIPNPELMQQLEFHQDRLRFLAVMDDALIASVLAEAARARVNPQRSVLMIEQGPRVSVALARR